MTVFFSFLIQSIIIGILILIPLIYTEALPKHSLMTFLMAPPPPPPPPPPPATIPKVRIIPKVVQPQEMVQPKAIPKQIAMLREEPAPPPGPVGGVVGGIDGGLAGGAAGGILGGIIAPPPPPPPPPQERIRVGGQVQPPRVVNQTRPIYPPLARQARIQGVVRLEGVIAKDGSVIELKVVSGHPLLIQSALDAVKQWRYQPTMLNGSPVEVITTIDVNFTLGG